MKIVSRSFGTHDGSFHSDEVTACALLLLFDIIDRDKVHRTRDLNLLTGFEYVCDVGGIYDPKIKRFDHHQVEYRGNLSSAGMILKYLLDQKIMSPELYDYFNNSLIIGIDAHDNGLAKLEPGYSSFSQIISNFLPIEYSAGPSEFQTAFFQALDFVYDYLFRLRKRFEYTSSCREKVKKCMEKSKFAMIFDEPLPWMENFFELGGESHPALFVVMPTGVHWKIRGIPPSLRDRMKVRLPLPQEWAGLHDHDLKKVTQIKGAIFCHKGRFISIWETKEDAMKALHYLLKAANKEI
ncbi:MAG TPA: MYG1 family protein [Chlamydiales bacterium]|nr:MYG1 family protein [Chlamydiales bacterium]